MQYANSLLQLRVNFNQVYSAKQGTIMQKKLFQMCTHFFYCSVLSLGGKVNIRQMSMLDTESIFTKIIYEIFWS